MWVSTKWTRYVQENIKMGATKDMSAEDILKLMLNLFQDIDKRLTDLNRQQSIWDIKQDEVLHYIENHNLSASQRCKIVKLLKEIRYGRRQVKDEIDIIRSLKDTFIDKYKNKFIEKDIIQTLKNLKDLEKRKNNPKYTYQYLTEELEIKDEICFWNKAKITKLQWI